MVWAYPVVLSLEVVGGWFRNELFHCLFGFLWSCAAECVSQVSEVCNSVEFHGLKPVLCAELCRDGSFSSSSFEVGMAEGGPGGVVSLLLIVEEERGEVRFPECAENM